MSDETNRNLLTRNRLVQFLALYTDRGRLRKHRHIETTLSRSSKVIDFGTNRKRVCDFLLVRHSYLGPILHRFGDMTAFMCSTPPLFNPNFGVFPLHQIAISARAEAVSYSAVKLFSKNSNLYDHGTRSSQTDVQTDDMQSHNRALR